MGLDFICVTGNFHLAKQGLACFPLPCPRASTDMQGAVLSKGVFSAGGARRTTEGPHGTFSNWPGGVAPKGRGATELLTGHMGRHWAAELPQAQGP